MHTGDWWWSPQEQLDEGATIAPLLLVTDKTMLTQHHGDLKMWPVYVTIGNLDISARRNQIRPSMVLLGLHSGGHTRYGAPPRNEIRNVSSSYGHDSGAYVCAAGSSRSWSSHSSNTGCIKQKSGSRSRGELFIPFLDFLLFANFILFVA